MELRNVIFRIYEFIIKGQSLIISEHKQKFEKFVLYFIKTYKDSVIKFQCYIFDKIISRNNYRFFLGKRRLLIVCRTYWNTSPIKHAIFNNLCLDPRIPDSDYVILLITIIEWRRLLFVCVDSFHDLKLKC